MTQRLLAGLLVLAVAACAQHRVDPTNVYHRVICVTPLTGAGTANDPVRPKYAPWPMPAPRAGTYSQITPAMENQAAIIAFSYLPSDDGRFAIVEYVARSRSAFQAILNDPSVQSFEKGKVSRAVIETALQKYRKGFNLEQFGTVTP